MSSPILKYSTADVTITPGGDQIVNLNVGYLPTVNVLRDSSTSLESVVTVGLLAMMIVMIVVPVPGTSYNGVQFFRLESGNSDGSNPDISVQPIDYDATLNNVHWQQVSGV